MTVPPTRKPGTNYADYRYQLRRTGKQAAAQAYLPTDVPLSTAIDTTRAHRHQPTADTPDSVSHVRGAGAFAFTDKEWKV
ncbi:hypothetical protein ACMXZS_07700 [Corynebacterium striatum]